MIYLLAVTFAVALCAAAIMGWLLLLARRQSMEIGERIEQMRNPTSPLVEPVKPRTTDAIRGAGMPQNSLLNDFELPNLRGGATTFSQWRGISIGVLFIQPNCAFSQSLLPRLSAAFGGSALDVKQMIVVSTGDAASNRDLVANVPGSVPFLLQEANELSRLWKILATPSLCLIDEVGVTRARISQGPAEILAKLGLAGDPATTIDPTVWKRETTRYMHHFDPIVRKLTAGERAPIEAIVPHLEAVTSTEFISQQSILVFSDPHCLACQTLLPKLRQRSRKLPGGCRILVANRTSVLSGPIPAPAVDERLTMFHHRDGVLGREFGTVETPSALVIDPGGRVRSSPVVGEAAILDMIDHVHRSDR